jgi:hypothetical protein
MNVLEVFWKFLSLISDEMRENRFFVCGDLALNDWNGTVAVAEMALYRLTRVLVTQ